MTNATLTDKTTTIMNRIVQVDNFQNMACCCANWKEFVEELAEWGVDGCAKMTLMIKIRCKSSRQVYI